MPYKFTDVAMINVFSKLASRYMFLRVYFAYRFVFFKNSFSLQAYFVPSML